MVQRQRFELATIGLPAVQQQALATRKIADALEAPTIRHMVNAFSPEQVGVAIHAVATLGMEYFGPSRRMNPEQIALFAETIRDEYPHESLADVNVFLLECAKGKYDRGEFYSSVDVPRLLGWWQAYLGDKADKLAEIGSQKEAETLAALEKSAALIPNLRDEVEKIDGERAARQRAESERMSLAKLRDRVKMYTDEQLRDTWKDWGAEGRSILVKEAERRGLLKAAMDKATKDTNTSAA